MITSIFSIDWIEWYSSQNRIASVFKLFVYASEIINEYDFPSNTIALFSIPENNFAKAEIALYSIYQFDKPNLENPPSI